MSSAAGASTPPGAGRRSTAQKTLYFVSFIVVCFWAVWLAQFSTYASLRTGLAEATNFVVWSWFGHSSSESEGVIVLAGLIIVALVYLGLLGLFNHFWLATGLLAEAVIVWSAINHLKVLARNEPLQPGDFMLVSNGATGQVLDFIPADGQPRLIAAIILAVVVAALTIVVSLKDRRGLVSWRRWRGWAVRAGCLALSVASLVHIAHNLDNRASAAGWLIDAIGDDASLWNPMYDYHTNGAITSFTRYISPTIMTPPTGYSANTMADIARRYEAAATLINRGRTGDLDDQSVIMILCESCQLPSLIPNLSVSPEPTAFLESLDGVTTTGLALSTGYGGGTANLEYQSLTGMSMGLFSPTLTTPFQQLLPTADYTPSAADWWDQAQAVHTYLPNLYSRSGNYQKLGMDQFWTLEEPHQISCTDKLPDNPYISDACSYQEALDALRRHPDQTQFISLVTMQNHGPYAYTYPDNPFEVAGSVAGVGLNQRQLTTFVQGMNHTDQATEQFLAQLDALDQPVTVVWYGDHSPSLFNNNLDDATGRLSAYQTPYFIYSNPAARGHGTVLDNAEYSSSNYFMAQVAEQTSSRVNGFLALMTRLHDALPAIGVSVADISADTAHCEASQRSAGTLLLLDQTGAPIDLDTLSARQTQLLRDYELVQYDITAGHHYLADTGFLD